MTSNLSKIKVGRLWGYPIIVTTGKSKHEAILLDCNDDNPQLFLQRNVNVKIRWKVAGYNDNVPASDVKLQNIDTEYYRPRRAVAAVDTQHDEPSVSKKRKTNKNVDIGEDKKPFAVPSGVIVKEEEIETDNDEEKPDTVCSSGINIKEEEVETDNDEDNKKPDAVPSSTNVNVKEEEVETDDDRDMKPSAVTSGTNVKEETGVETDNDEEIKPDAVSSSSAVDGSIKTEEVETDDDEEDDNDGKPEAVTSTSGVAIKTEEVETDDDGRDEFIQDGCLRIPKVDCTNESFFEYNTVLTVRELICWALRTENKVRLAKIDRRLGSTTGGQYSYSKTLNSKYLIDIYPETKSEEMKSDLTAKGRAEYKFSRKAHPQLLKGKKSEDLYRGITPITIEKKNEPGTSNTGEDEDTGEDIASDISDNKYGDSEDFDGKQVVPPTLLHFEIILEAYMGYNLSSMNDSLHDRRSSYYHHPQSTWSRAAVMGGAVVAALKAYEDKEVVSAFDKSGLMSSKNGAVQIKDTYWIKKASLIKTLHNHFSSKGDVDVFLQASPLTQQIVNALHKHGIKDHSLISHIGSYVSSNSGLCNKDLGTYTKDVINNAISTPRSLHEDEASFAFTVTKNAVSFILGKENEDDSYDEKQFWPRTSQFIMLDVQADLLGALMDFDVSIAACSYDGVSVRVAPRAFLSLMTNALFVTPFCFEEDRNKRRVTKYARRGFEPFLVDPHDNIKIQNVACDARILRRPFSDDAIRAKSSWFRNYEEDQEILKIQDAKKINQDRQFCCHFIDNKVVTHYGHEYDESTALGQDSQKLFRYMGIMYTQKLYELSEGDAIDFYSKRFEWSAEEIARVNKIDPYLRMACRRCRFEYCLERIVMKKFPTLMQDYELEEDNLRGEFSYRAFYWSTFPASFYSGGCFDGTRTRECARRTVENVSMLYSQSIFELGAYVLKNGSPRGYKKRFVYGSSFPFKSERGNADLGSCRGYIRSF